MSPSPVGDESQVHTGAGVIYMGPFGTDLPVDFPDLLDLDAALIEVGLTESGSEFSVTATSEPLEAAERLYPIRYELTKMEGAFKFTQLQVNPASLQAAMGGGTITSTVSSVKYVFPKIAGGLHFSIVWISENGQEGLVVAKAFSAGNLVMPRGKAPDMATIAQEFALADNPDGDNAWYLCDPALVS